MRVLGAESCLGSLEQNVYDGGSAAFESRLQCRVREFRILDGVNETARFLAGSGSDGKRARTARERVQAEDRARDDA